jgi:SAM-dependent methyltransferase
MKSIRGDKFYDPSGDRLVYVRSFATADFWDAQWAQILERDFVRSLPRRGSLVTRVTLKFLPIGSSILEGGCGTGFNSRHLREIGYQVTALDFANNTIAWLVKNLPEINPILGDVRALPFDDDFFDGYWSLGVIEHFYDGYDDVLKEISRVLRPGGYLFLTFPYLSPMRKLFIRCGFYQRWLGDKKDNFYQYALNHHDVCQRFIESGFKLESVKPLLGLSGVEDLWPTLEKLTEKLRSGGLIYKIIGAILNKTIEPLASHMVLLVLRKNLM